MLEPVSNLRLLVVGSESLIESSLLGKRPGESAFLNLKLWLLLSSEELETTDS
jgi:hypothetical protein